jgi:hypothetical protein
MLVSTVDVLGRYMVTVVCVICKSDISRFDSLQLYALSGACCTRYWHQFPDNLL